MIETNRIVGSKGPGSVLGNYFYLETLLLLTLDIGLELIDLTARVKLLNWNLDC
jgi:hypothetical protein